MSRQPKIWLDYGRGPLVEVVPLGELPPRVAETTAAHVQALLNLPAQVMPSWPDPDYALMPGRGQYDATPILAALAAAGGALPLRLGLVSQDLCLPFLTHVFGVAQVEGCSAVVSTFRLGDPGSAGTDGRLLLERVAKVALHEVAHVMGLVHCDDEQCLINFSSSLESLDRVQLALCPSCREQLKWRRLRLLAKAGLLAQGGPHLPPPEK